MMRALWFFIPMLLAAQEQPSAAAGEPPPRVSGSVDAGYRWRTNVGGNLNAYRSVVDLGAGPKLSGFDLLLNSRSKKWFDKANVRGNGWGGDPYASAYADLSLEGAYRLTVDYRNLVYFNFLPSFANPQIERGGLLSQNAYDTNRRLADVHLDLLPGGRLTPYLAYSRDWGSGRGVTDFVSDGNEYPVASRLRDKTNSFRGGVRWEASRFHVTLEQGGTTFTDDTRVFTTDRNLGNRTTPVLGQTLSLNSLEQAYAVRGDSIYSKAVFTANPASWIDVSGQFLYSAPSSEVRYDETASGQFVLLSRLLFYDRQQRSQLGEAKQPHSSGSLGIELRPLKRVRIVESWLTDRMHNASSTVILEQFLSSSPVSQADRLALNYNQQRVDIFWDATARLTLRGGHKYVWGDTRVRAPQLSGDDRGEASLLRRHSALAGLTYRPSSKLSVTADAEAANGDRAYFRTSLNDFQRVTSRARYQASGSLSLSARFSYLKNENPAQPIQLDFLSRENAATLVWTPDGGKRASLTAEYGRSIVRSDVFYREPQTLDRQTAVYREKAHTGSAVIDLKPALRGAPVFGFGGSFFTSSGSRPARYYQPLARVSTPLRENLHGTAEWRWYGFSQTFQTFEGFRAHQFSIGLRLIQ